MINPLRALLALLVLTPATLGHAEVGARGTYYTRCTGEGAAAYAVDAAGNHAPDLDEICKLPTAPDAGVPERRCTDAQAGMCEGAAPSPIHPRDVPNGGLYWFAYPGINGIPTIRCICGCFAADTQILTNSGWHELRRVLSQAGKVSFQIALPGLGSNTYSAARQPKDFTVGPEKIAVLALVTSTGEALTLTTKHPVLVKRDGHTKMVQASAVVIGDTLTRVDGRPTEVTSITPFLLPSDDNLVYNVRTGLAGQGGLIGVNGLLMGDLTWQSLLSERASREASLLKAGWN